MGTRHLSRVGQRGLGGTAGVKLVVWSTGVRGERVMVCAASYSNPAAPSTLRLQRDVLARIHAGRTRQHPASFPYTANSRGHPKSSPYAEVDPAPNALDKLSLSPSLCPLERRPNGTISDRTSLHITLTVLRFGPTSLNFALLYGILSHFHLFA